MRETVEVLITIPLADELVEEIRQVSEFLNITHIPANEGVEIPEEVWAKTEVLYTMHVLPKPEQVPNLRWVQAYLAGVDKIIDNPALTPEQVLFSSMSGANATQVAEHILTMMLALGHNLPGFGRLQREHSWMQDRGLTYVPREIRGSTVGLVGYGSIGRQTARLVTGMGAEVLAIKRNAMTPEHHGYSAEGIGDPEGGLFTRLYPPEAIRSMVAECDYVVICVPKTSLTAGIISAEQINAMKKTALLIDVSRGGIVDHTALSAALAGGKIAGAALDVFPEEPLPEESDLWELPNLIITPHISGFSPEYSIRANELLIENLTRYLSGQGLLNLVSRDREYSPMSIRAVIFDLGNTLLYFDGDWAEVFARADQMMFDSLTQAGLQLEHQSFVTTFRRRLAAYHYQREIDFREHSTHWILADTLSVFGYSDVEEGVLRDALAAMYTASQEFWLPEDDLLPALESLTLHGYRIGLLSNAGDDRDVQKLVDKGKIRPYLEYVLTSAAGGIRKPDSRIFELAINMFGLEPGEVAMVGDTLNADILGANQIGVYSIWITRRADTPANRELRKTIIPDAEIETLAELPILLGSLK